MLVYLATAVVLILYLVLVWFTGTWLHLQGANLWLVRLGLALIGLVGAGAFLWFYRKLTRDAGDSAQGAAAPILTEIDSLLNQADQKLKSAKPMAGASLRNLPVVFLLGEPNSAKTTTMLHSGLDPELLAGVVYRESEPVPTNPLNVWFSRGTLFVEIGGAILGDTSLWNRILKRTNPGMGAAIGKQQSAPRAVVVCCDCERLRGGVEKSTSTARKLAGQLQAMANSLGASFPVYVLFTKLDQVQKFEEFVSNLTSDEARQILGATVAQRDPSQGVFAEEEKNRLGKEFDQLVYSLAEKRLDYLGREHDPGKLPAIYEFPRELRKIRDQVLAFLVEMTRPTQLGTNSFLRGFYFSGIRPVMLRETVAASHAPVAMEQMALSGATRMLSVSDLQGRPAASGTVSVVKSRKVPEWTFLPYLFSEVILRDRSALGTSSQSSKPNTFRKLLLAALAAISFGLAIAFFISFLNNHRLQQDVMTAANALSETAPAPVEVPSAVQLTHLEKLRWALAQLEANERDGVPLSYGFGLYQRKLLLEVRRIYFSYFLRLLLNSTEKSMASTLGQLRATPGQVEYLEPYNTLKAYLIITGCHDKSSEIIAGCRESATQFLSPVLLSRWSAGKELSRKQTELAGQQFQYYSETLVRTDPYHLSPTPEVVEHARAYLKQFNGIDRIYKNMLAEAGKNRPPSNFNHEFPGSAQVVINSEEVPAAFTREGFAAMQDVFQHLEKISGGEDWVLGEKEPLNVVQGMQQKLSEQYYKEFVGRWRSLLKKSEVVPFTNLPDALRKLNQLSLPNSPLLELFWFISENTNVERDEIKNAFQPVRMVVAPTAPTESPKFTQTSNQKYIESLGNLQTAITTLASNPADPMLIAQAISANAQGSQAAKSTLYGASSDEELEAVVLLLLNAPFDHTVPLISAGPKGALNAAGQALCTEFAAVAHFFPFNTNGHDLPVAQLNQVLAPDSGALWVHYNQTFKQYLSPQGEVMNPAAKLNPTFVMFFKKAAEISRTLYPSGSPTPRVGFTLRQTTSNLPAEPTVKIGTETLSGTGPSKMFYWTGNENEEVQVTTNGTPLAGYPGPWAVFHFAADGYAHNAGSNELEYTIKNNDKPVPYNGKPETYSYQLQVSGVNVFNPAVWSGLRCVPQVVK